MSDNVSISAKDSRDLPAIPADLNADLGHAAELAEQADAPATRRAYASDIRHWQEYAYRAGLAGAEILPPIDPAAWAAYLGNLDVLGLAVATIRRRCSAIARWHRERGEVSPTEDPRVRRVLRGLARARTIMVRRKRAITPAALRAVLLDARTSPRDAAILSTGFVTGLRRGELAALTWADVEEHPDGLAITIRRSKTDQGSSGAVVAVPYGGGDERTCPVRLLLRWRLLSPPLFEDARVFGCSARTIARAVKLAATRAGLEPAAFGAHSLRAGLATCAAEAGVSLAESMAATRHRSAAVAASYVRPSTALANRAHRSAAEALGG